MQATDETREASASSAKRSAVDIIKFGNKRERIRSFNNVNTCKFIIVTRRLGHRRSRTCQNDDVDLRLPMVVAAAGVFAGPDVFGETLAVLALAP